MTRCFACGRTLKDDGKMVACFDEQTVEVGPECFEHIVAAGAEGYQPPFGGPMLITLEVKADVLCRVKASFEKAGRP